MIPNIQRNIPIFWKLMNLDTFFFLFLTLLFISSCGQKYYYVTGGPRPKNNTFKVSNLKAPDFTILDTNAIYLNEKSNWFYKFHAENKVGYFYLDKGNLNGLHAMTSDDGKMGYFELSADELTTYLFVKHDFATFIKEHLRISHDTIFDDTGIFVKKEYGDLSHLKPDW